MTDFDFNDSEEFEEPVMSPEPSEEQEPELIDPEHYHSSGLEITLEDIFGYYKPKKSFTSPLIVKWMKYYRRYLIGQDHSGLLTLFSICSAKAMKNNIYLRTERRKIDLRIPIIKFSNSGSGKGEDQDAASHILTACGLSFFSMKSPTPAKLIGSIDKDIERWNLDKNVSVENPIRRTNQSVYVWKDPRIPGLLEKYHILFIDEAERHFNKTHDSEEVLRTFRCVVDNYGTPTNWVMSETLKNRVEYGYHAKTNFIIMSYHLANVHEQVTRNGLFQRCIVFIKHFEQKDISGVMDGAEKFFVKQ